MGREFELKYAASEAVLAELLGRFGPGRQIRMESTYFDTPHHALSAGRMTLRLRKENEESVCTLKTPLPDGSRGEWECAAADIESGIAALLASGAPALLQELTAQGVVPVCGACFTRHAIDLPTEDGTAELALDKGSLSGGGKEIPLVEVEIELKSGSEEAACRLAAELAKTYGLQPESKSKFRRAMDLVQGE